MSTIQGTAGPIAQVSRYGFSPQSGFYTAEVHIGTKANIRALLPGLIAANTAYDCQDLEDGAMSRLEIKYSADRVTGQNPTETAVVDTWELYNNMVLVDVLDSNISAVQSLALADLKALRAYVKSGTEPSPALTGDSLKIQELIAGGMTSVEVRQAIIRHTATVSSSYVGKAAQTNAGRILSRATLQADGVPTTIMWNITDFSDSTGVSRTGFTSGNVFDYGWLKSYANVTQQTYNTWQIQLEYKFGLWARTVYLARV